METPRLGAELVGDVVHVHLRVRDAAGAVRLSGRGAVGPKGGRAGHERDDVRRAVVGGEEDGVVGADVHRAGARACGGGGERRRARVGQR